MFIFNYNSVAILAEATCIGALSVTLLVATSITSRETLADPAMAESSGKVYTALAQEKDDKTTMEAVVPVARTAPELKTKRKALKAELGETTKALQSAKAATAKRFKRTKWVEAGDILAINQRTGESAMIKTCLRECDDEFKKKACAEFGLDPGETVLRFVVKEDGGRVGDFSPWKCEAVLSPRTAVLEFSDKHGQNSAPAGGHHESSSSESGSSEQFSEPGEK